MTKHAKNHRGLLKLFASRALAGKIPEQVTALMVSQLLFVERKVAHSVLVSAEGRGFVKQTGHVESAGGVSFRVFKVDFDKLRAEYETIRGGVMEAGTELMVQQVEEPCSNPIEELLNAMARAEPAIRKMAKMYDVFNEE